MRMDANSSAAHKLLRGGGKREQALSIRPKSMAKQDILPWLVQFTRTDVRELAAGPPGDIPNLVYRLRSWLDLEPDEPLSAEVQKLEGNVSQIGKLIAAMRGLLQTVADRTRYEVR